MKDYIIEDLLPLKHFSHIWEHRSQFRAGEVVEVPSVALKGRMDQVLVLFNNTSKLDSAGLIVRNRGKYSAAKSRSLAVQLSEILQKCQLSENSHCEAYEEGRPYYAGSTDEKGLWANLTTHRTAPRYLGEAQKFLAKAVKRPKSRRVTQEECMA